MVLIRGTFILIPRIKNFKQFQVNGKDVTKCKHQEAVMALIAPTYDIHLVVRHDPPPNGLQVSDWSNLFILVRKEIEVNEHRRLSNITLLYKLK
jgi:hypothetical protein